MIHYRGKDGKVHDLTPIFSSLATFVLASMSSSTLARTLSIKSNVKRAE